jgi:signal transduction histidine kinase
VIVQEPNAPMAKAGPEAELERLREESAVQTTIINSAAHELSTPLTPIRLQLHMLKTGEHGALSNAQREAIEVVDRNVERLTSFVKELLDVARLGAKKFPIDMRPLDLSAVVKEAIDSYRAPIERAGLRLEQDLESDLVVLGDPRRLVQVVFNLLSNALKFTPPPGKVTVSARRISSAAAVEVRDTGIGIRKEDLARLFSPFSQVYDEAIGYAPGAGLGLFISKSIIELHGGQITAESEGPQTGTKFSLSLPLARPGDSGKATIRSLRATQGSASEFARRVRELV